MARLRIRLGTMGLLLVIVALTLALFIQWRREADLRVELERREANLRAELRRIRQEVELERLVDKEQLATAIAAAKQAMEARIAKDIATGETKNKNP